jgi:hypothetical protein
MGGLYMFINKTMGGIGMGQCETYRGTLIAAQDFQEKIIKSNIENQEIFMKELQEYLNRQDASGNFATFNYVFRKILKKHSEYMGLADGELVEKIKAKCEVIENGNERKKFRNRILGFLEESKSKPNRQCVIEVAIVLGFSLNDLEELLQKGLFQTTISYSNYKELIGAYCLVKQSSYNEYIYILNRFETEATDKQGEEEGIESKNVREIDSFVFQKEMKNIQKSFFNICLMYRIV